MFKKLTYRNNITWRYFQIMNSPFKIYGCSEVINFNMKNEEISIKSLVENYGIIEGNLIEDSSDIYEVTNMVEKPKKITLQVI